MQKNPVGTPNGPSKAEHTANNAIHLEDFYTTEIDEFTVNFRKEHEHRRLCEIESELSD